MARPRDPSLQRQRRTQVLDSAIALLEEGSWHGTSLAAVAARAGVSKGVVTYWFPDKDAVIVAAIDRYRERYFDRLQAIALGEGTVETRLTALLEAAFPSVEAVTREAAFHAEAMSYAKAHPEVAARAREAYQAFREVTGALIAVGVAEGYVVDPPPDLHRFVHALIDGLSLEVAADPSVDLPELRRGLKRHLERWFRSPPHAA